MLLKHEGEAKIRSFCQFELWCFCYMKKEKIVKKNIKKGPNSKHLLLQPSYTRNEAWLNATIIDPFT